MHLHIIPYDKYGKEFIDFINEMFPEQKSLFFITYVQKGFLIPESNSFIISKGHKIVSSLQLLYLILKAKTIIHHGLFVPSHNIMLSIIINFIRNKYYWVLWGGDLYYYLYDKNRNLKNRFHELFRKILLKRIKYTITPVDDDFDNLKSWYSNSGDQIDMIPYPNLIYNYLYNVTNNRINVRKKILVGNSATKTNNHAEIFYRIYNETAYDEYDIIVPLNYGDSHYRDEIVAIGERLFGDSFFPILDFMNKYNYEKLLSSIDFAIFYHDRQQAMGNIVSLLSKSIPVYIKKSNPLWSFFQKRGLFVLDANSSLDFNSSKKNVKKLQENSKICKITFSKEKLYFDWSKIIKNNG